MKKQKSIGFAVYIFIAFASVLCLSQLNIDSSFADSWSTKYLCDSVRYCPRFTNLYNFNNAAVLDRETGLVWQKNLNPNVWDWYSAQNYCNNLYLGGRKGWRLPTLQELESLVDSTKSNPALPIGHPFTNVVSFFYWTATTSAQNTSNAWLVKMSDGSSESDGSKNTSLGFPAWCVRGGQGTDYQ